MHQRLGERGGTRREMLWGNTRLCIWRMQLFTPGQGKKPIAGLRHALVILLWMPLDVLL